MRGPLGEPSEIDNLRNSGLHRGGVGVAPIFPITRALRQAGNRVISIIGARSDDLLFYESEMESVSDELQVMTDDGSKGRKGLVTEALEDILKSGNKVDLVFAVGPVVMMRAAAELTKKYAVRTIVSLNPVMVDGTGMCGGCRVSVGGADQVCLRRRPGLRRPSGRLRRTADETAHIPQRRAGRQRTLSSVRLQQGVSEMAVTVTGRNAMPTQDPKVRVKNFDEVALGYTKEQALLEANRCRQCKKKPCSSGCPVGVDIPALSLSSRRAISRAPPKRSEESNNLPAICGRVCPQEEQCEKLASWGKRHEPMAIGRLERFVADYERTAGDTAPVASANAPKGKKVAVVGSGPSGLTVAADLTSWATGSRCSRPCMIREECWSTAFRSSGCRKRSSRRRSTTSGNSAERSWWTQ